MTQDLTNDLTDFVTMQLYLITAVLYCTNGVAPGKSLSTQFWLVLKGPYYGEPVKGCTASIRRRNG